MAVKIFPILDIVVEYPEVGIFGFVTIDDLFIYITHGHKSGLVKDQHNVSVDGDEEVERIRSLYGARHAAFMFIACHEEKRKEKFLGSKGKLTTEKTTSWNLSTGIREDKMIVVYEP